MLCLRKTVLSWKPTQLSVDVCLGAEDCVSARARGGLNIETVWVRDPTIGEGCSWDFDQIPVGVVIATQDVVYVVASPKCVKIFKCHNCGFFDRPRLCAAVGVSFLGVRL